MTAHISQKFKKLDEISHVLLRPGRYIGSINPHTAVSYAVSDSKHKMESTELTWCPALLKIFDEIISNSVDYSKTESGSHLDTIKVFVDKDSGAITVYDNGGIVVVKHPEHDQYIPEMIFELRAGSNFNDDEDSTLTGQNGEGAALTSIFSTSFTVDTADGKNKFLQTHSNNSRDKTTPIIKRSKEHYTKITFTPDFPKLNLENLTEGDFRKIEKRVYDVAGCNPQLKIYFNDTKIDIKNFEDYIKMYVDEYIYDHNDNWKVGISKSDGGFSHVSFVNSTETTIGGLHVSYIADQIIVKLREYIEKKHKIQIKPSEIKNHLNLFINCNIIKPRYSSQTKEDMITEIKNFGTTFEVTDKFIKNIIKSSIVQSILDWAEAKANANLLAEMRKLNKTTDKLDPSKIIKLIDALEKKDRSKCILFLTEGDCIDENESIVVYENDTITDKRLRDIQIGDLVLTHNNRFKPVLSTKLKVMAGIKVKYAGKTLIISHSHRLIVYDIDSRSFIEIMGRDLNKDNHKLVKSQLVNMEYIVPIAIVPIEDELYDLRLMYNDMYTDSTETHKFYVWDDVDLCFGLVQAKDIITGRHYMVLK